MAHAMVGLILLSLVLAAAAAAASNDTAADAPSDVGTASSGAPTSSQIATCSTGCNKHCLKVPESNGRCPKLCGTLCGENAMLVILAPKAAADAQNGGPTTPNFCYSTCFGVCDGLPQDSGDEKKRALACAKTCMPVCGVDSKYVGWDVHAPAPLPEAPSSTLSVHSGKPDANITAVADPAVICAKGCGKRCSKSRKTAGRCPKLCRSLCGDNAWLLILAPHAAAAAAKGGPSTPNFCYSTCYERCFNVEVGPKDGAVLGVGKGKRRALACAKMCMPICGVEVTKYVGWDVHAPAPVSEAVAATLSMDDAAVTPGGKALDDGAFAVADPTVICTHGCNEHCGQYKEGAGQCPKLCGGLCAENAWLVILSPHMAAMSGIRAGSQKNGCYATCDRKCTTLSGNAQACNKMCTLICSVGTAKFTGDLLAEAPESGNAKPQSFQVVGSDAAAPAAEEDDDDAAAEAPGSSKGAKPESFQVVDSDAAAPAAEAPDSSTASAKTQSFSVVDSNATTPAAEAPSSKAAAPTAEAPDSSPAASPSAR